MLGTDLARHFRDLVGRDNVLTPSREELDITDWKAVGRWVTRESPKVFLNAAAYTNVDLAEKEREQAYQLNVMAVANLTEWCDEFDVKLVHFSTDQVFNGEGRKPWTESDEPSPLNYYAETKLAGETEALRAPHSLVLRVQWLYGEKRDRFTPLKDKERFTPFSDQFGAPTWTKWVAELTAALLEKDASGVFHLTHDDFASWAEVFAFVKDQLRLNVKLEPQTTASVSLPAKRPLFSVLSNEKTRRILGREGLGSWRDSLQAFLKEREAP